MIKSPEKEAVIVFKEADFYSSNRNFWPMQLADSHSGQLSFDSHLKA